MQNVIEVSDLSHCFGAVQALLGLTFSVQEGEVFGYLGPNGAGKTTTVRLLNGILAATSGRIRVMDMDPITQGSELRQRTGVLTETPSLYERLTARENLKIFGALYGVPQASLPQRVDALLDQFGLAERADDRVGGFSKGMKQRLALARTILHQPGLLFLDEPTSGLDPEASQQVMAWIEQISHQKGCTVFLCTHNLDEAERLCDRVAVLNHGRLLAEGTLPELSETLWRGRWLDVQLESPLSPGEIDALRRVPGVRAVEVQADGLSIQMDRSAKVPDLVCALVYQGARLQQVTQRRHTLEDIYFQIQKQPQEG